MQLKIIVNVKIINTGIMKLDKLDLKELSTEDKKLIEAGGWIGIAIGVFGLVLTSAAAKGYYDGKNDCMPPPCK